MQVTTFVIRGLAQHTHIHINMDTEQVKKQTLMWMNTIPRDKLNKNKMVMVIRNGIPKFIPKHLVSCEQDQ